MYILKFIESSGWNIKKKQSTTLKNKKKRTNNNVDNIIIVSMNVFEKYVNCITFLFIRMISKICFEQFGLKKKKLNMTAVISKLDLKINCYCVIKNFQFYEQS